MNFKKIKRYTLHLHKSGCIVIGLEHFLVMFPSAMLVARLASTAWGSVIELPAILFASGFGTLMFALLTKRKIPFFLGPSFSYIGFVSYQVGRINSPHDVGSIRSTIYYGYIIAGVILLILSLLYRYSKTKRLLDTLFPSTIMGPAISLIGLELANMAAEDSGFTGGSLPIQALAVITLVCIIVFSLLRHHFLQNASILIGVIIGCLIATLMGQVTWPNLQEFKIVIPKFYLSNLLNPPQQWITLTLAVFPCALIAFVESLGRLSVYEGMLQRDEQHIDQRMMNSAISFHSCTSILTSATNMMPSAIYAENLAIMNLHSADLSTKYKISDGDDPFIINCYSSYSIYPYVIASLSCIAVAMISGLQEIFLSIPMSVLGGMELFVFGLISAPGIQMLVDQQINYKKISNQIITASVFLAGISDISISYGSLTLRGMSLGLTIGVLVNIISLILGHFGYLNDKFSIVEIIGEFADVFEGRIILSVFKDKQPPQQREIDTHDLKEYICRKENFNMIKESQRIELYDSVSKKTISILQENGRIELKVLLPSKYRNILLHDNQQITASCGMNRMVTIVVNEYVSRRLLREILKNAR